MKCIKFVSISVSVNVSIRNINPGRLIDSLELQAVAAADGAGASGLQLEERGAGGEVLAWLVLTQVQTEEAPESWAGGRHHEPVGRHPPAVTTDEDQVSVTSILREKRGGPIN